MTSLLLTIVFQCLFTFALVFASPWLAEIWQLSRRGATGELQVEFKFRRRSCKRMSVKRGFGVGTVTRVRVRVRVCVNPYPKTALKKKLIRQLAFNWHPLQALLPFPAPPPKRPGELACRLDSMLLAIFGTRLVSLKTLMATTFNKTWSSPPNLIWEIN